MEAFDSRVECDAWLRCNNHFIAYLRLTTTEYLYRRIENNIITKFAKIEYKNGMYYTKIAVWPEKRCIVKLSHDKYWADVVKMLNWLKDHEDSVTNAAGGILEPDIFFKTEEGGFKTYMFSFLKPTFATEFKLIWS